ncbi:MAG TPA: Zn-ribbon domain-containing OB-fold protein [Caulobacterales bacterium]|nr:Zn-ribbon domain-containing OB-fold protein [Caulobacterales bacterium]
MLEPPLATYALKPTTLTQPFWDAARAHKLLVQQCSACAKKFFRPEVACPHCRSRDWRWVESSGKGKLYSFSVLHRSPSPAFRAPFIFAAIEMDEGWTLFSNLVGLEIDDAHIGMAVEVCFHTVSDELTVPLFRPASA